MNYIAIGNNELNNNKELIPGEFIPCRNCGNMCIVKTHILEKIEGSIETTTCVVCKKTYLVGSNHKHLWEINNNEVS